MIDEGQNRFIQNIEQVHEKKKFGQNRMEVNMDGFQKGAYLFGVGVQIKPETLFGLGAPAFTPQITPCHFMKRALVFEKVFRRNSRGRRRIVANAQESLAKFGMDAALRITNENHADVVRISVQNRLKRELGRIGQSFALVQNDEARRPLVRLEGGPGGP